MKHILKYRIFESNELDFIKHLFADSIEDLESDFVVRIRPYSTYIHRGFGIDMPDIVLEISKSHVGETFSYEKIFKVLINPINQLENFNDVNLIGLEFDYRYINNHQLYKGRIERKRPVFDNFLDMEQFKSNVDNDLNGVRIYFRFGVEQ